MKPITNVVLILNDDMGYSDLGCYGGEIDTPNLNRLAEKGLRFTQFYNTARCSPSRASLLTGLHPHQAGVGILTNNDGPDGYPGNLNTDCLTMAEVLKHNGYRTYMAGKWHLANDVMKEQYTWPLQRGFDSHYGILSGAANYFHPVTLMRDNVNIDDETLPEGYYFTDAISDRTVEFIRDHARDYAGQPFFQYVAYTSPHWPLHAKDADIAKYKGKFDKGWDQLREERLERMKRTGLLKEEWNLTDRDPSQPAWTDADYKEHRLRGMEVYAAQIDCMDQGIGRIIAALEETGQLENTVIIFLADNGGCAEELKVRSTPINSIGGTPLTRTGEPVRYGNDRNLMPGGEDTYQSYGVAWANLSNTPFRLYKHWIHEGGISTPFIMHWPDGIKEQGGLRHSPCQLTDVLPTVLEITGTVYPDTYPERTPLPLEGESMVPLLSVDKRERKPLYWEHEGNAAVRIDNWKLVRNYPGAWELFDLDKDRSETRDLAAAYPDKIRDMSLLYEQWAKRCKVLPREQILNIKK
jgi:arylsulfatase A-like enzyme